MPEKSARAGNGCPHFPRGYGSDLIVVLLFLLPPALLLLLVLALLHAHLGIAVVGTAGGLLDRMFRLAALFALWFRRWRLARVAAGVQVSLILWGWALSQKPYILRPDLTIADATAPPATLRLALAALAVGAVVLLPSLFYLFRVFKGRDQAPLVGPR